MITARSIPVAVLTCEVCEGTFTRPRKRGRYPATCSDTCKAERGAHGPVRVSESASTGTGFLDMRSGERHSSDSEEAEYDTLLSGAGGGWIVAAESAPVRDSNGEFVRDDDGRVKTRFRNYFAESNSNLTVDVPAKDSPVIGQWDLPHDWQERLDQGEPVIEVRMAEWLGLGIEEWADGRPEAVRPDSRRRNTY